MEETLLIDDFGSDERASIGTPWRYVSDTVMGGVSQGHARHEFHNDRRSLLLSGTVSLENNGGFIQAALDLEPSGRPLDASNAAGVTVTLCGDGRRYAVNLRTADTLRPWQSYRSVVETTEHWQTLHLPFASFIPHRIEQALRAQALRRIGLIAIGSPGAVSVAASRIAFYKD